MANPETPDGNPAPQSATPREREADHRARNALQLISSLILLQGRHSADAAAAQALKSAMTRVAAVSAAHRRTSWTEDREQVDVAMLVRDVVGDVTRSAGREGLAVELDLDPAPAPGRVAAPLALIVSEAVGNAIVHAFPRSPTGRILVALRRQDGSLELCVEDDGDGPPSPTPTVGFGLTVVEVMTRQLRGQLIMTALQPGFRMTVTAPLAEATSLP